MKLTALPTAKPEPTQSDRWLSFLDHVASHNFACCKERISYVGEMGADGVWRFSIEPVEVDA